MSTSGTSSWNPVRDTVIRRALRMVGAYASSDNPRAEQVVDAIEVLALMLKDWQMDGMLWLKIWATLFLNKGQRQYVLGPSTYSGFSHCAFAYNPGLTPYIQTNINAAASLGVASVSVVSATGISSADYVGIADDNGLIEWFYAFVSGTTIYIYSTSLAIAGSLVVGVSYLIQDYKLGDDFTNIGAASNATGVRFTATGTTPTIWTFGSSVSAATTLTAAVTSGNVVYSHKVASQINRPTRIFSFARKLYSAIAADGYEIPFDPISRTEYESLPNKTVQGKIIETYYDPQLVAGLLYVWPTADTPGDKLILTMDRPIQDILSDQDTFDAPQEALDAIAYCLALQLEPEYPLDNAAFQKLATVAVAKKQKLLSYNRENVPTQFQPDMR